VIAPLSKNDVQVVRDGQACQRLPVCAERVLLYRVLLNARERPLSSTKSISVTAPPASAVTSKGQVGFSGVVNEKGLAADWTAVRLRP
jgi:hypothetical protein